MMTWRQWKIFTADGFNGERKYRQLTLKSIYDDKIHSNICIFWILFACEGNLLLFSCQVVSDSLQPRGLWHARLLCPPLSPRVSSNSCPLRQWCHRTISSSVVPFSFVFSLPQYQGLFHRRWLFTSGDQCLGASASVLSINFKDWFPLGLISLIYLQSKGGLSRAFSSTTKKCYFVLISSTSLVGLKRRQVCWFCDHPG